MLNIDEHLGGKSNFLKAADLQRQRMNLTIAAAELRNIRDENKVVLSFENTEKELVLNKTNGNMIAELLGSRDALQWVNSTITIRPDKTQMQDGKVVDCIRVDFELPQQIHQNSLGARAVGANPLVAQTPQQQAQAQNFAPASGGGTAIESEKIPF